MTSPSTAAENEERLSRLRTIVRKLHCTVYYYELFSYQLVNRRPYKTTFIYKPPLVMSHPRFSCALDKVFSSQDSWMDTCRIGCNLAWTQVVFPSLVFVHFCVQQPSSLTEAILTVHSNTPKRFALDFLMSTTLACARGVSSFRVFQVS